MCVASVYPVFLSPFYPYASLVVPYISFLVIESEMLIEVHTKREGNKKTDDL